MCIVEKRKKELRSDWFIPFLPPCLLFRPTTHQWTQLELRRVLRATPPPHGPPIHPPHHPPEKKGKKKNNCQRVCVRERRAVHSCVAGLGRVGSSSFFCASFFPSFLHVTSFSLLCTFTPPPRRLESCREALLQSSSSSFWPVGVVPSCGRERLVDGHSPSTEPSVECRSPSGAQAALSLARSPSLLLFHIPSAVCCSSTHRPHHHRHQHDSDQQSVFSALKV